MFWAKQVLRANELFLTELRWKEMKNISLVDASVLHPFPLLVLYSTTGVWSNGLWLWEIANVTYKWEKRNIVLLVFWQVLFECWISESARSHSLCSTEHAWAKKLNFVIFEYLADRESVLRNSRWSQNRMWYRDEAAWRWEMLICTVKFWLLYRDRLSRDGFSPQKV